MEKRELSAMLAELPPTKHGEFLARWPEIKTTLARGVDQKAIYKTLTDAGLLKLSYVTFTRYVKKASSEEMYSDAPPAVANNGGRTDIAKLGREVVENKEFADPAPSRDEDQDKSATIATSAAGALKDAKAVSSSKNYANNVRKRNH